MEDAIALSCALGNCTLSFEVNVWLKPKQAFQYLCSYCVPSSYFVHDRASEEDHCVSAAPTSLHCDNPV